MSTLDLDAFLDDFAADMPPPDIAAKYNAPMHRLLAQVMESHDGRRKLSAAYQTLATALEHEADRLLTIADSAPKGHVTAAWRHAQSRRTRARDCRRQSTSLLRRQPDTPTSQPQTAAYVKATMPTAPKRRSVLGLTHEEFAEAVRNQSRITAPIPVTSPTKATPSTPASTTTKPSKKTEGASITAPATAAPVQPDPTAEVSAIVLGIAVPPDSVLLADPARRDRVMSLLNEAGASYEDVRAARLRVLERRGRVLV